MLFRSFGYTGIVKELLVPTCTHHFVRKLQVPKYCLASFQELAGCNTLQYLTHHSHPFPSIPYAFPCHELRLQWLQPLLKLCKWSSLISRWGPQMVMDWSWSLRRQVSSTSLVTSHWDLPQEELWQLEQQSVADADAAQRLGLAFAILVTWNSRNPYLVGGLEHLLFFHILWIIIPID